MFENKVKSFITNLQKYHRQNIFNPWSESDNQWDIGADAAVKRSENLYNYLIARRDAKFILVAEALGYQGGHFSGIAMTSERLFKTMPSCYFFDSEPCRTSCPTKLAAAGKPALVSGGFCEPTGSIVWKTMLSLMPTPTSWLHWNTFAFHPHKPGDTLTNRTPTDDEVESGKHLLVEFLNLFPNATVVAVGRIAHETLTGMGYTVTRVRHPANGGATEFKNNIHDLLSR